MVDSTRQVIGEDGPERRLAPRTAVRLNAAYEDADRQIFLVVRDISEIGVFLAFAEPPAIGAPAQITLELPDDPMLLRLRGTVVRHSCSSLAGFALRFDPDAVPEVIRERVRRFVTSANDPPPPAGQSLPA